jgi:streptogramin lyase
MRGLLWLGGVAMLLGMVGMPAEAAPPASKVERVGQPCRAFQVLGGCVVRDPVRRRELFAITNMNEVSGAELLFIDAQRNQGQLFHAPAGAGCWAILPVPDDLLVLGTFYDGHFMVFDLKQRKFIRQVRLAQEEYIWNLAPGGDGRLYGGTYPGGKLGALNVATGAVEDCGAPAAPNLYLRYVSPTPDGRLLCSFGNEKPTTKLYDPTTKRFEEVPATLEGAAMGCVWDGRFLAGSRVFQGRSFTVVTPPFPSPPADKGAWYADVALTTADSLFLRQGNALYRYRKGDRSLKLIVDIDLRGGRCLAANSKGEVLGIRGQDYFLLKPGDKALHLRPIPIDSAPRQTLFLKSDAHGRLWGGPTFGQTLFSLDPRSGHTVNTGAVCDAGGEIYDVAFRDGKVYTASYAGGDITEYDPTRPWDQWNLQNPRPIATVGGAYIRPVGGIVFGADGKLYSGWMAKYGTYGGAVAITDPATRKTELIANPLGEQAVSGLAVDARYAYIGTSLAANGLPNKTGDSPRFGVFDLGTRKPVYTHVFDGASEVHALAYDPLSKRVAMAVSGKLHLFDTDTRTFVPALPANTPPVGSNALCAPGQGTFYYGSGKSVVRVEAGSGTSRILAELPASVTNVTVAPDGAVYASCGADIYRVGKL